MATSFNNRATRILLALSATLTAAVLIGCEDVVQVDLNSTAPKLVIEGYLSSKPTRTFFRVSRSTNYFDPSRVEMVSGALIIISDSEGRNDTLLEHPRSPGLYYVRGGIPFDEVGATYTASVTVEDKTYTATTTLCPKIEIDSVTWEYQPGGGFGTEEDEGYRLHAYFQDQPDRADYARFIISKVIDNQNLQYFDYYLYDGRFSDGNEIDYDYFFNVFQPGEKITVEVISMDRAMYYYFLTLSEVAATGEGSSFDATPANPNTNWSGGALGYFGAFQEDSWSGVVRPR